MLSKVKSMKKKKPKINPDYYVSPPVTKSFKKLVNYFEEIKKDSKFLDEINLIRLKYGFPLNGFSDVREANKYRQSKEIRSVHRVNILDDLGKLAEKYSLNNDMWRYPLNRLLYYGKLELETEVTLIAVSEEEEDKYYPVYLKISPYSSKRDILDFIDKRYSSDIEPVLVLHKKKDVKLGRVRSKNKFIQKRNEYIMKYQDLPRAEIMKKVQKKFGYSIDVGSIGKIISLEKKKREIK